MTSRLAFSTIYPLFMDQYGRSLQFCHIKIDKEAISDGCVGVKMPGIAVSVGSLEF